MPFRASILPYFGALPWDQQQAIIKAESRLDFLEPLVVGKWNWYKEYRDFPVTVEGLNTAARNISADLIREKRGASVDEVRVILLRETYWARLWDKAGKILDMRPWYLKPTGMVLVAGLVYFGPGMLARFLKARQ